MGGTGQKTIKRICRDKFNEAGEFGDYVQTKEDIRKKWGYLKDKDKNRHDAQKIK